MMDGVCNRSGGGFELFEPQQAETHSFLFLSFIRLYFFGCEPGIYIGPVEFDILRIYPYVRRAIAACDVLINGAF
jgi:hypothetical protein